MSAMAQIVRQHDADSHNVRAASGSRYLARAVLEVFRELVAYAPDCPHVNGIGRVGLDLAAKTIDVRVHGVLVTDMIVAPHEVQQLLPRVDAPRVLSEMQEEFEFLRGQFDRSAIQRD